MWFLTRAQMVGDGERTKWLRELSLSPFRSARKDLDPVAQLAPLLPELNFNPPGKHDMNGYDTLRTANATPPRPTTSANMVSFTTPRNVSGPLAVESPTDQNGAPIWTRPNFHSAPSNSKTSQYIDKITSENDRLRRELKVEKLAREEEAKRVSAAKSKAEDSRADFQHLQVLADTNARAIERKDRKLDELKAALDAEVHRRKVAEERAEEALKMLGDTRSETQRQLSQAYEMKHMADTHLETARDGFKRITESYEKKLKSINDELYELRRQRIEDADKIKRQAIISDQLHHEMSRTTRTEANLSNMMEAYKAEHKKEMDALIAEAENMRSTLPEKEEEAEALVEAMKETRDKMKWVMTQHAAQQSAPQPTPPQHPVQLAAQSAVATPTKQPAQQTAQSPAKQPTQQKRQKGKKG